MSERLPIDKPTRGELRPLEEAIKKWLERHGAVIGVGEELGPWATPDMFQGRVPPTGWGPNDYPALFLKYRITWNELADARWRKACEEDAVGRFPEAATDPLEGQE